MKKGVQYIWTARGGGRWSVSMEDKTLVRTQPPPPTIQLQNTEYRLLNIEYRIQNKEFRIKNTEYRHLSMYKITNVTFLRFFLP